MQKAREKRSSPGGKKLKTRQPKSKKRRLVKKATSQYRPNIDVAQERKKPRLGALLFCQFFSQDDKRRSNLIGCFDRLYVDPETRQTGSFYIFIRTAETRSGEVIISIIDPASTIVAAVSYEAPDNKDVATDVPMYLQFYGQLAFKAPLDGVHWVDVSHNGQSIGGATLTVQVRKTNEAQTK